MKTLRRHNFRKWLESHESRQLVGQRGSSNCCPLASYLRERGSPDAAVRALTFSRGDKIEPLPRWAQVFIHQVDFSSRKYNKITAGKAIQLLDKATILLAVAEKKLLNPKT